MSATSLIVPVLGLWILCLALARRDSTVPATASGAANPLTPTAAHTHADSSVPTPPTRLTHPPDRPAP